MPSEVVCSSNSTVVVVVAVVVVVWSSVVRLVVGCAKNGSVKSRYGLALTTVSTTRKAVSLDLLLAVRTGFDHVSSCVSSRDTPSAPTTAPPATSFPKALRLRPQPQQPDAPL